MCSANRAGGREAVASLILKNQEKGTGAGAFELGGWGCVPGCYISSPATLHAWPVQKADWNVGQTHPPLLLSLSLSVSIPFCHKHYSTAEVRKTERMCDIGCKPLFWLIKSNKKRLKTAVAHAWHVVRAAFTKP